MGRHVVLLGDSIFDNGAYTDGAPDVIAHLQATLPPGWLATLVAVDGSRISDLPQQISRVPQDASHLVVSIGGNDVLRHADLLSLPVRSTGDALDLLGARSEQFAADYRSMLARVLRAERTTIVCTIYNGRLREEYAARAEVALRAFNDTIIRLAAERGVGVIELRAVCTSAADYANPIEPSGPGGAKIARAVARAVGAIQPEGRVTRVFT